MNDNKNILVVPDRKKLPYGGAEAVVSSQLSRDVEKFAQASIHENCIRDLELQDIFLKKYRNWILSSTINHVKGLEQFDIATFSNGTTEAFDKFYLKNRTRRFRCFRGEYMYHMAAWRNYFPDWQYLDSGFLDKNDAVVISYPFSDLGQGHMNTFEVLDTCAKLQIPVLLDCAYFGICGNMTFDFTHPAITDITFSLSKFLPVAHYRIGIRFTRRDDDDSLIVMNKTSYTNRFALAVGSKILDHYDPDYVYNRYRTAQLSLCDQLGIIPSKSVIFGIDYQNRYAEYNRGAHTNRLCLAKYLDQEKNSH